MHISLGVQTVGVLFSFDLLDLVVMKRQAVILSNQTEYGEKYHRINFVNKEDGGRAEKLRSELLDDIKPHVNACALGSKIYSGELSPGCRLCVEGKWSCLFINNVCNAGCFYCPTSQNDLSQPSTDNMVFRKPQDYVSYISEFGFKGVSFSGGEPLLSFDRTLEYLKALRRKFGNDIHIWMYTNGILLTAEKAAILAEEGLDEIRFDISANNYSLDKIRLVSGKIPVITVEIPAIPENLGLLKQKAGEMVSEGVQYLNLHQLRLTSYNFENLLKRNYTFLHGARVTVLESELTALEMIRHTLTENISLPVNYCSFVYKNRFQGLAARKIYSNYMKEPWENLTDSGYLRSIFLPGDLQNADYREISTIRDKLYSANHNIYFPEAELFDCLNQDEPLHLLYQKITLKPSLSYSFPSKELMLGSGLKVFLEKQTVFRQAFANSSIVSAFLKGKSPVNTKIRQVAGEFEALPQGLAEYF